MNDDAIGRTVFSADLVASRVQELGEILAADYRGRVPLLLVVLRGSLLFGADLLRSFEGPVEVDFITISSYGDDTTSSGQVRVVKDGDENIAGRDVVIVEDIVDSGRTLAFLYDYLREKSPASIATCSLLVRDGAQADTASVDTAPAVDYVGFALAGDAFVVGYGLDVAQRYRNLKYIAEYNP